MKIIAITQARISSTRLPGKVLKEIHGKPLLRIHLERAMRSRLINKIIVATTHEPEAFRICNIAEETGAGCYRGSLTDVLDRYYQAALPEHPDYVVRITSDCPLIDPELMDEVIGAAIRGNYDYVTNTLKPTYPNGTDVEIMKFAALESAWKNAILPPEREHVTPYIRNNSSFNNGNIFTSLSVEGSENYSGYSLTVDTPKDFERVKALVEHSGEGKSWMDYLRIIDEHPALK